MPLVILPILPVYLVFLCCWRCHSKLILIEENLDLKTQEGQSNDIGKHFISRVYCILKYHSGVSVKTLKFEILDHYNIYTLHLNYWLETTITPGIEEVTLLLHTYNRAECILPCSFSLDGCGKSIWYLYLMNFVFRPTAGYHCLRSLTKMQLYDVHIAGDELCCLFPICLVGAIGTRILQGANLPEDTILPGEAQLPESVGVQPAANNQKQSSSISFVFGGQSTSFGELSKVKNQTVQFSLEPNFVSGTPG